MEARVTDKQAHKWKCPVSGTFKINVDAAIPKNGQWFSVGMIMRDST